MDIQRRLQRPPCPAVSLYNWINQGLGNIMCPESHGEFEFETKVEQRSPDLQQASKHDTILSAVWLATGWVPWFLPSDTFLPGEDTSSPTYTTLSPSHFLRSYHHLTFYVFTYLLLSVSVYQNTNSMSARSLVGNAHRCTSMVYISTWPMTVTRMNKWIQRTKFPKVYVKILPSC